MLGLLRQGPHGAVVDDIETEPAEPDEALRISASYGE